ncbi:MAG TPA: polysaccharide deacetylase family protein [Solirubrobacteraceae bacterium]|jgi:peptidoglycan/xylan/chitin deacetylase (PgdA/CDA1 family)|nr:polysaccharide deacetylase family protein [Solirubrobacteraceae bacterium]
MVVLAGLLAVLAAVLAVVVLAGGGSSAPRSSTPSASKGPAGGAKGGAGVRAVPHAAVKGPHGTEAVPILMYHVINPPPAGAPFPGLYVPAEEFSEQIHALAHAGYHAVTQDQLWANWKEGVPLPSSKPIVLTFDNGYQSQYTNALPLLRRLGWAGVENLQLTGLPPSQGGLSPTQVRGLVAGGWELDTQGFSHADLITLDPAQLHYQVAVARSEVQRLYHVPVNWFCYPSGHYDAAVLEAVHAAGYRGSTTVVPGWAQPGGDPYRLPRLRVLGGTTGSQLLSELAAIRDEPAPPASYGSS